jgi:hypothetical protein
VPWNGDGDAWEDAVVGIVNPPKRYQKVMMYENEGINLMKNCRIFFIGNYTMNRWMI